MAPRLRGDWETFADQGSIGSQGRVKSGVPRACAGNIFLCVGTFILSEVTEMRYGPENDMKLARDEDDGLDPRQKVAVLMVALGQENAGAT